MIVDTKYRKFEPSIGVGNVSKLEVEIADLKMKVATLEGCIKKLMDIFLPNSTNTQK